MTLTLGALSFIDQYTVAPSVPTVFGVSTPAPVINEGDDQVHHITFTGPALTEERSFVIDHAGSELEAGYVNSRDDDLAAAIAAHNLAAGSTVVTYTTTGQLINFQVGFVGPFVLTRETVLDEITDGNKTGSWVLTPPQGADYTVSTSSAIVTILDTSQEPATEAPAITSPPTISGVSPPIVGQPLGVTPGPMTGAPPPTVSYQWQRASTLPGVWDSIAGQTGTIYTPVSGDVGRTIRVRQRATNSVGTVDEFSAATSAVIATPTPEPISDYQQSTFYSVASWQIVDRDPLAPQAGRISTAQLKLPTAGTPGMTIRADQARIDLTTVGPWRDYDFKGWFVIPMANGFVIEQCVFDGTWVQNQTGQFPASAGDIVRVGTINDSLSASKIEGTVRNNDFIGSPSFDKTGTAISGRAHKVHSYLNHFGNLDADTWKCGGGTVAYNRIDPLGRSPGSHVDVNEFNNSVDHAFFYRNDIDAQMLVDPTGSGGYTSFVQDWEEIVAGVSGGTLRHDGIIFENTIRIPAGTPSLRTPVYPLRMSGGKNSGDPVGTVGGGGKARSDSNVIAVRTGSAEPYGSKTELGTGYRDKKPDGTLWPNWQAITPPASAPSITVTSPAANTIRVVQDGSLPANTSYVDVLFRERTGPYNMIYFYGRLMPGEVLDFTIPPGSSPGEWVVKARAVNASQYGGTPGDFCPHLTVTVSGTGGTAPPDTTPPTITSAGTVTVPENQSFTYTLTASEPGCTFVKAGGADAAFFTLAGATVTGGPFDFESPQDSNTNNTYVVTFRATDPAGNVSAEFQLNVVVTDVADTAGYDTDTDAAIARLTSAAGGVAPTTTEQDAMDVAIRAAKALGVYPSKVVEWVLMEFDTPAHQRTNWVNTGLNVAENVGTPTYLAGEGIKRAAFNDSLTSQFEYSSETTVWAQDSACAIIGWKGWNGTTATKVFGSQRTTMTCNATGTIGTRLNSSASITSTLTHCTTGYNLIALNRNVAPSYEVTSDAGIETIIRVSAMPAAAPDPILIGRDTSGGGSTFVVNTDFVLLNGCTQEQVDGVRQIIKDFRTAVGATA